MPSSIALGKIKDRKFQELNQMLNKTRKIIANVS